MRLGFTATRTLDHDGRLRIRAHLEALQASGAEVTEVTTGGALGGDTYIAGLARVLWPNALHRLVLPAGYGNEAMVTGFERGLAEGRFRGEIVRTGLPPLKRNHVILDHADHLLAFPRQVTEPANPRVGGGTWATVRYARKRGLPLTITPVVEG